MNATATARNRLAAALATLAAALTIAAPAASAAEIEPRQADPGSAGASVVGGYFPNAQWPWMAGLLQRGAGTDYDRHFCGGTLVHPRLIVTAAHCLYYPGTSRLRAAADIEVVLGKRRLSVPGGEHIAVTHVQIHPSYNRPIRFSHDVALLYLAAPSAQTPAALGSPSTVLYQGNVVTAMGWGLVQGNAPYGTHHANDVKAVDLAVWGDAACANRWGAHYDPATMICAGYADVPDNICNGDSGGPLMYLDATRTWRLIGVTSWVATGCPGYTASAWAWLGNRSIYAMIANGIATAARLGTGNVSYSGDSRGQAPAMSLSRVALRKLAVRRGGKLRIGYRSSHAGRLIMQYTRGGRRVGAPWQASTSAGSHSIQLPVRNRGRALRRGAYGLTVWVAGTGRSSNAVRLAFRVR